MLVWIVRTNLERNKGIKRQTWHIKKNDWLLNIPTKNDRGPNKRAWRNKVEERQNLVQLMDINDYKGARTYIFKYGWRN